MLLASEGLPEQQLGCRGQSAQDWGFSASPLCCKVMSPSPTQSAHWVAGGPENLCVSPSMTGQGSGQYPDVGPS